MSTIKVENITMKFKEVVALDNISVTFEENKIYGLLGRNGAGKSTLLNLITNKLFPTGGHIKIDNENVIENEKALINVYCMSEKTHYLEDMKLKDVFKWSKTFYPDFDNEYAMELAEKFKLNTKKKVKGLSTGYTSIFKIIIALACNTPIILLDEPVLGLDANHRDLFYKELIKNYTENPRTIVISTHLIEEVSDIIEQVVIIKDGKLLLDKSAQEIMMMGYGISGKSEDVDQFTSGKQILGEEVMSSFKTAFILGDRPKDIPESLTITAMDLQQLFIKLTNA